MFSPQNLIVLHAGWKSLVVTLINWKLDRKHVHGRFRQIVKKGIKTRVLYSNWNSITSDSRWRWLSTIIGLGNDLVPSKQEAIDSTKDDEIVDEVHDYHVTGRAMNLILARGAQNIQGSPVPWLLIPSPASSSHVFSSHDIDNLQKNITVTS